MAETKKGVLVTSKDNQLLLRHEKYKVHYIVEINYDDRGKLEVTYLFDPTVELTKIEKDEIIQDTQFDLMEIIGD